MSSFHQTNPKRQKRERNDNPSVRLSKKLSSLLRHRAEDKGLPIRGDGFVNLSALVVVLKREGFPAVTPTTISTVVANCEKKRFELTTEGPQTFIRATQGHTIKAVKDEELLAPVMPNEISICIHGTYSKSVEAICATGLNKMSRNNIHMAESLPGIDGVVSGTRANASVIVIIDVVSAMAAGIPFFRSSNNVILSPGLDGIIHPAFILDIVSREDFVRNMQTAKAR